MDGKKIVQTTITTNMIATAVAVQATKSKSWAEIVRRVSVLSLGGSSLRVSGDLYGFSSMLCHSSAKISSIVGKAPFLLR
jgi:hypothetical protein